MPDFKAILTGQSWNANPTLSEPRKPVFLTYSFSPFSFEFLGQELLTSADRQVARKALKMWGDASGITFLEVSGHDAEIRFRWEEADETVVAWAKFPKFEQSGLQVSREYGGGEVNLNTQYKASINGNGSYKLYLLLHEIGHALGLKHPFDRLPNNGQLLDTHLDNVVHTVMAYEGGDPDMARIGLGELDKQAIQALYGIPSQDGQEAARWNWNGQREILTQTGGARNDTLLGVAVHDSMRGLKGKDRLYGFDGDDTLSGGLGNDVLAGGDGADQFRFDTTLSAARNTDRIVDFDSEFDDDTIVLSHKIFKGLAKGHLGERLFAREGVAAASANDWFDSDPDTARPPIAVTDATRIIFNETTRFVSYDADGSGPVARIRFAKLAGTVSLDAGDFFIV